MRPGVVIMRSRSKNISRLVRKNERQTGRLYVILRGKNKIEKLAEGLSNNKLPEWLLLSATVFGRLPARERFWERDLTYRRVYTDPRDTKLRWRSVGKFHSSYFSKVIFIAVDCFVNITTEIVSSHGVLRRHFGPMTVIFFVHFYGIWSHKTTLSYMWISMEASVLLLIAAWSTISRRRYGMCDIAPSGIVALCIFVRIFFCISCRNFSTLCEGLAFCCVYYKDKLRGEREDVTEAIECANSS